MSNYLLASNPRLAVVYTCGTNNKNKKGSITPISIACWNVRTLLDIAGADRPERRTALIGMELKRYNLDIVALSETRFSESGSVEEVESGYTFFWKGKPEGVRREAGVGFAIRSSLVNNLSDLPNGISERLISLRVPLKHGRFMTLISVYAPTLTSAKEDIDMFYGDLKSAIQKVDRQDKLVVLGDFNARVGQDFNIWSSLGRHGIGKCNDNGHLLLQLCQEFSLKITNTCFRQKDKFKTTWKHPRSGIWHILDYVIVRTRDIRDVLSVRCMRGAECWTDHRLVRAKLALYILRKRRHTVKVPKRIDVSQFSSAEKKRSFLEAVNSIAITTEENPSGEFSEKLYESAASTLGFSKRKSQDWFLENSVFISDLLIRKKQLWDRLQGSNLSRKDRVGLEKKFQKCKAEVQREIRAAKDKWWSEKANQIQLAADKKDTKTHYHLLRSVYGPPATQHTPLRSKDGSVLLTKPEEIEARWCEHHNELLNRISLVSREALNAIEQVTPIPELDVSPSRVEVMTSLGQMNTGKAPGKDGITAELLKQGGDCIVELLYGIFQKVWENDTTPKDWRDAILVSLYKKGPRDLCGNYRGISLLSVVGKVFSRVLLNRLLKHIAPSVLPESQCGFRPNRGTVDMIFTARQVQEKCIEHQLDLYQCFIDLTKAFDTVNREALWTILMKLGCTEKFTGLIRSLHDGMEAWICFNGELSEPIPVENGVKQGDLLAPTLFAIFFAVVLDRAFAANNNGIYIRYRTSGKLFNIRRLKALTKTSISVIRDLLYADDCDLVAHTEADIQNLMDCLSIACDEFGLTISLDKTVMMYQPAPGKEYQPPEIFVKGELLKVVDDFIYLGSKLTRFGDLDKEISHRISKAVDAYGKLEDRLWSSKDIKQTTKINVYKACVLTALLYGCESWTFYRSHIRRLERFHQHCLRGIMKISWTSRVPDTDVLDRAILSSVEAMIMKQQLRWSGHVVRLEDSRLPKQALYGEMAHSKRPQSKPKKRYKDCLKETLTKTCIDIDNWEECATDRAKWKSTVYDGINTFEAQRVKHAVLRRHARYMEDIEPPVDRGSKVSLTCHICSRICLSRAGLKSHLRSHESHEAHQPPLSYDILSDFTCQVCNMVCKSAGGLKRHAKSQHPNEPEPNCDPLQCSKCTKKCKSLSGLKSHLRSHQRKDN